MLKVELGDDGIAVLNPGGELSRDDFISATKIIDPYIDSNGQLRGIIIHVQAFPGWDSFSSLIAHLKFAKEYHKKVSRIALATDWPIGSLAENIAGHFINAEIRTFQFSELEASRGWILNNDD